MELGGAGTGVAHGGREGPPGTGGGRNARRGARPPASPVTPPPPTVTPQRAPDAPRPPTPRPAGQPRPTPAESALLLQRLRGHGLLGISALRLTRNRSTLVSYRGGTLRVHEGFARAPEEVLRAIAVFVTARGTARAAARRLIVSHPLERDATPRPPRRTPLHPDDRVMAERLQRAHARLNLVCFGGALRVVPVTVSRRMKSRLGHYAPARSHPEGAEIAISRRHIKRHGWTEAFDTLLHEMVHQWQEENGHPIDHGPLFRQKAHEVGTTPRAKRTLR